MYQLYLPLILACFAALTCLVDGQARHNQRRQWDNDDIYPGDKEPPYCPPDAKWACYEPPYYPYDQIKRSIAHIGNVIGRSLIYHRHRYINIFLGIPYARPPYDRLRFKPPETPGPNWDMGLRDWDASYYRDACPQEMWKMEHRYYEQRNMSEDCLHLNIFSPNLTDRDSHRNRRYPVFVFVQGEDFKNGDSLLYPGHIIAKKEVLVVTFNYRLGALGFMSTGDSHSTGNYGLMDILKVLEFIQLHIEQFRGDPSSVTLVGSGSGAASIGLLLLSPKSQGTVRTLFHQVALMGGTDLCEWSVIGPHYRTNPREYAHELGRRVGCDPDYGVPGERLVDCLRKKHYVELVNATAHVWRKYGSLSGPFGPVVDGLGGVLPDTPKELRKQGKAMNVRILAGVTKDEGAYIAENITKNVIGLKIEQGMSPGTFRDILMKIVRARPLIRNVFEVVSAMEYEYTFWPKPDNRTAVRQNLIDFWSDMMYGWCVDATLKEHAIFNQDVYMYVFDHRSDFEPLPEWMGVPHGRDVDYLFGHPFFNETMGNLTGVVPDQWDWTYLDKNISHFVSDLFVNFTKDGVPTPDWTRNVSWYPYTRYNLSFLHIAEWAYMDINYRQNHYAFWREYYPTVAKRWRVTTTPIPTPHPRLNYQYATWSLMGISLLTLFIVVTMGITLWRRTRSTAEVI